MFSVLKRCPQLHMVIKCSRDTIKTSCYARHISSESLGKEDSSSSSQSSDDSESSSNEDEQSIRDHLYPGRNGTTAFQKILLAVGSSAMSLATPWRDDMIATMGEVTGYQSIKYMHSRMVADPTGQLILRERPRINSKTVDLDYLKSLPQGTFGREYITFLEENNITPDNRRPVNFVDDPDLAYVMQRYREVHDLVHTIVGMPTTMLGEVCVKWIEGLQLRLPLGLTGGLFGAARLLPKQRQMYLDTHLWWALRVGRDAKFLMNIYYEDHWEKPIEQLRMEMNIEEPPFTPKPMKKKS